LVRRKDKIKNVLIIQTHTPKTVAIPMGHKWLNFMQILIYVVLIFKITSPLISFSELGDMSTYGEPQDNTFSFSNIIHISAKRGEHMCSLFPKFVILFWMHTAIGIKSTATPAQSCSRRKNNFLASSSYVPGALPHGTRERPSLLPCFPKVHTCHL
jgi:hypothetical protein